MKKHLPFIIIFLLFAVSLLINVGSFGVVESSDARYAEIAREMYVSGDFLHPDLLGIHHYHKPPFTYQITALGYKLFGTNPFGARFFLQIAILLQLVLIYLLTLLLFENRQTALWAVIIYMTYPIVLASSRNLTTDAFLATFTLWSIYAWVKYRKTGKIYQLYFFTLSLGLGFLTKGPVIFIVPVSFILFFNRTEKAKVSFSYHHILAGLLFLGLASSWFIYLSAQNQNFIDYFLGRQTVDRFSKDVFGRTEPFYYFLVVTPVAGLLWFILLPVFIKDQYKTFKKRSIYTVLLMGFLIPFLFFSISSSKRILYILPVFSLLAILTAQLFSKIPVEKNRIVNYVLTGFLLLLALSFSASIFIHTEFSIPLALGIFSIFMLPFILWVYRTSRINSKSKSMYLSVITSVFLLISSSVIISSNQLKANSPKPVTDFILKEKLNNRNILIYNTMKPSIAFGLNKPVISLYDGNPGLKREIQFEEGQDWKRHLIDMNNKTEQQYLKQLLQEPTVLLVYKEKLPKDLEYLLGYYKNTKIMGPWTIYY